MTRLSTRCGDRRRRKAPKFLKSLSENLGNFRPEVGPVSETVSMSIQATKSATPSISRCSPIRTLRRRGACIDPHGYDAGKKRQRRRCAEIKGKKRHINLLQIDQGTAPLAPSSARWSEYSGLRRQQQFLLFGIQPHHSRFAIGIPECREDFLPNAKIWMVHMSVFDGHGACSTLNT
jgi:hypothetical protein